jgi:hypothetical protein
VLWFGPQIVGLLGGVLKRHWIWLVAAVAAAVWVALVLRGRARQTARRE